MSGTDEDAAGDDAPVEAVILFHVDGAAADVVLSDLELLFPEGDVEPADNFIGGRDIAVYIRLTADALKAALGVMNRYAAIKSTKLVIDPKKGLELSGYSADDVVTILARPEVSAAIATVMAAEPPSRK